MATVEGECAAVLVQLSEAVQSNGDSSSFKNSCPSLQRFDSPEIGKVIELSSTTTPKTHGGFTCCVPGCFNNNKRNRELAFYALLSGKTAESIDLRKQCMDKPHFAQRLFAYV